MIVRTTTMTSNQPTNVAAIDIDAFIRILHRCCTYLSLSLSLSLSLARGNVPHSTKRERHHPRSPWFSVAQHAPLGVPREVPNRGSRSSQQVRAERRRATDCRRLSDAGARGAPRSMRLLGCCDQGTTSRWDSESRGAVCIDR